MCHPEYLTASHSPHYFDVEQNSNSLQKFIEIEAFACHFSYPTPVSIIELEKFYGIFLTSWKN